MKKVDVIVVGLGLAGLAICELLRKQEKAFIVYDNSQFHSSTIAGGVYNPVILKRFSLGWMADEQLGLANGFYSDLEVFLNCDFNCKVPVYRKFNSIEEQNNWFVASDKTKLNPYLSTNLLNNNFPFLNAPLGFGEVLDTGWIDTHKMLSAYKHYLIKNNQLIEENFDHSNLKTDDDCLRYKHQEAERIVFAEGYGLKANPFFNYLPLNGTKGEILIIEAPELKVEAIVKSSVFLIPLSNDQYYVGATYNHREKDQLPTKEGKNELVDKLKDLLLCDFKIVNQLAGIRPTVKDRRPLVGWHTKDRRLGIINGLGTRGVMVAPYAALQLINSVDGKEIHPEMDIKRFIA